MLHALRIFGRLPVVSLRCNLGNLQLSLQLAFDLCVGTKWDAHACTCSCVRKARIASSITSLQGLPRVRTHVAREVHASTALSGWWSMAAATCTLGKNTLCDGLPKLHTPAHIHCQWKHHRPCSLAVSWQRLHATLDGNVKAMRARISVNKKGSDRTHPPRHGVNAHRRMGGRTTTEQLRHHSMLHGAPCSCSTIRPGLPRMQ